VSGIPETPDPQLVTLKAVKIRRMWFNKKPSTHIQEFVKVFKEIIPLTIFLEASVKVLQLIHD
jgi:hypothetical protein